MRGDKLFTVLEFIEEGITTLTDLTLAIIVSGYGASGKKIDRKFEQLHRSRKSLTLGTKEFIEQKRRLYNLLYKLGKEGMLIPDSQPDRDLKLSKKGKKKFLALKQSKEFSARKYRKYKKGGVRKKTIVMFDIPESKKHQRVWLRSVLKNLGFKMVQKSVWSGDYLIPRDFIKDLSRLGLLDYVEIYEINKSGSLRV
ncbi:MAG: CRISPR-associated endonuclease Cas2 [Patescibacteria group bacterium]